MPGKYVTKSSQDFLGFFTTPISVAWFTPKLAIWNISSLSIVSQKLRSSHLKAAPKTKETTFIFSSHFLWITLFGIFLGFEELQKCLSNWNRHKLIDSFNIYTIWYPLIPMISTNTNDIHQYWWYPPIPMVCDIFQTSHEVNYCDTSLFPDLWWFNHTLSKKHRKNCECCPGHYLSTSVY